MEMRNFLHRANDEEKIAYRKKAMIFAFFLVLSLIFWFINALSKSYITTINYPVRYTDLPAGKTLIGDTPDYLVLKVSAHGYSILRHKLSSRYLPVNLSLRSFYMQHINKDDSLFFLQSRFTREHINAQLSSEIQILEINPDTLYFRFASLVTKKIPVLLNLSFKPDKQMITIGSPVSEPDSVIATGPDYILDTLSSIHTVHKNLGVVSQTIERKIDLQQINEINLKTNNVNVFIGIEKFTEKTLAVPLEITNRPDSTEIITFPAVIEITCQVGLSNFPKVQPQLFRAQVDFNESINGTGNLTVNLTKQPDFVRSIKYSPRKVEYLILK